MHYTILVYRYPSEDIVAHIEEWLPNDLDAARLFLATVDSYDKPPASSIKVEAYRDEEDEPFLTYTISPQQDRKEVNSGE